MACHAVGRCRICARRHKLPVFGSEENQHALIELVKLRLIILDTVCIDCIAKFEQLIKGKESPSESTTSADQSENPEFRGFCSNSPRRHDSIGAQPTLHFYVESAGKNRPETLSPCENERLWPPRYSSSSDETTTHRRNNRQSTETPERKSSLKKYKENLETPAKSRATGSIRDELRCDFCEKEFTHKGDLKRHKRKHTGEQPYECTECEKKFSQLSNLSRHRLVHSGERPFACDDCGQSYSRKGRLTNHIGRELCGRRRRIPPKLLES